MGNGRPWDERKGRDGPKWPALGRIRGGEGKNGAKRRQRRTKSRWDERKGRDGPKWPAWPAPARSVSPTISKIEAGHANLKSWLQTTPHKQKGNTVRNKNHGHPPQVDLSKPAAAPVQEALMKKTNGILSILQHIKRELLVLLSSSGGPRSRTFGGKSFFTFENFFSCIAGRVRDMVGQLLEIRVGLKAN